MQFPHGPMRRKDREIINRHEIDSILEESRILHLAMSADNQPFLVPLYYAYDGSSLYFHSAKMGTKMEILRKNPRVCFSVMQDYGFLEADEACDFEARHQTVIGSGVVHAVENATEKARILRSIIRRFTDKNFELPEANIQRTAVMRIEIESIKGKRHGM